LLDDSLAPHCSGIGYQQVRRNSTKEADMRPKMTWLFLAVILACDAYGRPLLATSAVGFVGKTLSMATFDEMDINLHTIPANIWQLRLKTKGLSDLYVQSNTWDPRGSTGWHTHPGPSLVTITAGTVTTYDGDDDTCTPHVYSALPGWPHSFVDPGGGHVHLVRNEDSTVTATAIAVQLIPQAATRRIDVPNPGNCPF
jgi:hypothetical protein